MKNPQLDADGRLKHLLSIEGLPKKILNQILDTAESFVGVAEREVKKVPLLRGKTVCNLFFENSTRTRTTFEIAAKRLSADVILSLIHIYIKAPHAISKYIAVKGSICVDGVSLTVNHVARDTFSINLIPHTLENTTLKCLKAGSLVNLEVDQIARYVERMTEWASESQ